MVFPNISYSDGYAEMMGLAPSIKDHEAEIIEKSIEGGIENARLPDNTYSEDYEYHQRSFIWDLDDGSQCRSTCWYIKEKDELIAAWIESLVLKDDITQNDTLTFFSPDSTKEEIVSTMNTVKDYSIIVETINGNERETNTYIFSDNDGKENSPEMYMIPVFANSEYLGYTKKITGKTDRDFLLADINNLSSDENVKPIEGESIVLYVDNVPYCFFRDGTILSEGKIGTCSDYQRVCAISYWYHDLSQDSYQYVPLFFEENNREYSLILEQNGGTFEMDATEADSLFKEVFDFIPSAVFSAVGHDKVIPLDSIHLTECISDKKQDIIVSKKDIVYVTKDYSDKSDDLCHVSTYYSDPDHYDLIYTDWQVLYSFKDEGIYNKLETWIRNHELEQR